MPFNIRTAVFNANNTTGGTNPDSSPQYNTPTRTILEDGGTTTLTIAPGEQHALAFACMRGSCNITIGAGNPAQLIEAGEATEWTAGSLLDQEIEFELVTGRIVITTIRRPPIV